MKICSICKISKNLDEFHKLKHGKLGRHSNCKTCRSKYNKNLKYEKPINGFLKCQQCHKIKDINSFYRNRYISTGVQSYCIDCHKEKIYESQSKLDGFLTKLLLTLNKDDKNKLSLEEVLEIFSKQNKKCALSNELLTYYIGPNLTENKYESNFNIYIDRIDDSKPYNKNNIQLIGHIIHRMKNNISNHEFMRLCGIISEKNKLCNKIDSK